MDILDIAKQSWIIVNCDPKSECADIETFFKTMTLGKYLDKHSGLFHPTLKRRLTEFMATLQVRAQGMGRKARNRRGKKRNLWWLHVQLPALC